MKQTPVKRVAVAKEKIAVLHTCSQVERLKRIELILVGNGHPEDGYVYKVMEMGEEIKKINDHLTGISGVVKELHEESIGHKATGIFKDITFGRVVTIAGIIIAIVMMWQGYKSLKHDTEPTKAAVEMTNDAIIKSQPRGTPYNPLANDTIK
jgi:hypothetical protein